MRILLTIITLSFSVNLFSQTFQQAIYKHANDVYAGQGISNRHNGDGTLHSSGSLLMEVYFNAYIGTHDLHFLDQLAIQCFRIQTHRDDRIRNYTDFDTDLYYYGGCDPVITGFLPYDPDGNPTASPTWSNVNQNNCIWTRFTLHSMSLTYPMALLVKLILVDNPALQNRPLPLELVTTISAEGNTYTLQSFGDLAQFLRVCIRETLDYHLDQDGFIFDPITQYEGVTDKDGSNAGDLLAVNMQTTSGKTLAMAYLIENYMGNVAKANFYHEKLTKISELVHGELVHNPNDNYSYSWRHQYEDDCNSGQSGFQNLEDMEHGQIIMDFADICFSNDIPVFQQSALLFEEEDMKKFASTFKNHIYINPDTYAANVLGTSDADNCQQLQGLAINNVFSYIKMAKYDKDIYGIISDLYAKSAIVDVSVANHNFYAFASLNMYSYLLNPTLAPKHIPDYAAINGISGEFNIGGNPETAVLSASENKIRFLNIENLNISQGFAVNANSNSKFACGKIIQNLEDELAVSEGNLIRFYNYTGSAVNFLASYSSSVDITEMAFGNIKSVTSVDELAFLDQSNSLKILSFSSGSFSIIGSVSANSNGKLSVGDVDVSLSGEEIIYFDNANSQLKIYNANTTITLIHSMVLSDFFCSGITVSDFDNDGLDEIVAVNGNDGDFYIFKIVDGVLKESGREYFPVNFQNGLITAIHKQGEVYPNQLLCIRKFDGKATVYDMAGKCSYLDLSDFNITEGTSIDNAFTGAQNDYPIDYHSPNIITASNVIIESDVTGEFVSGTAIRMKDGFRAKAGCEFTARIDDVNLSCDEPFFRNQLINQHSDEEIIPAQSNSQIKIYPNPSTGIINIQYPESFNKNEIKIQLFDNTGRILYNLNNFTNTIDISAYANGIYYLTISTFTQTFHEKVIKN
jgi:hypothetical protein